VVSTNLAPTWYLSYRNDPKGRRIADRHYNRQKVGALGFVPPGRCLVLLTPASDALWVTSYPFAEYVKHAWAGAFVNSLFRREPECEYLASDLITAAAAATRAHWSILPELGMVSFIDATKTRRKRDPGRCYRRAGWTHVGFTKGALWVFQLRPEDFPPAQPAASTQPTLWDLAGAGS
jgi:hypothetical protein